MLNKHGEAELWFGIAPNGSAWGLDITEKTLRDISQAIDRRIRFIEAWGRGVPLILASAPNAQFEEMGGLFITRFTRQDTQKATQKTTREQILALLSQDNKMTRNDLAEATGVSANAIKQHLSNLQKDGLLIREGGRKLGRWKVMQQ